jgi:hypothetical protein
MSLTYAVELINESGTPCVPVVIEGGNFNFTGTVTAAPPTASTVNDAAILTVGTSSQVALAANTNRVVAILQNNGTNSIFVLYGGGSASPSNYTYILRAGGTTNDGSSPQIFEQTWKGAISVAASSSGGSLAVTELTA